jgi:flavin-dependent dehydrogenase
MRPQYDVVIAGGGLAGLTLARQLLREAPGVRALVLEKRRHPAPQAAFKVGESSVEIGAHYFETVLGLGEHLCSAQLPKLGLRYFFTSGANDAIERRVEVGPAEFPPVPSFQLDRGRFENALLADLREAGVAAIDGCTVRSIELGNGRHRVTLDHADGARTVEAGFVADASGRTGLIRRQLGLTRPVGHAANAVWFRVGTRIKVDEFSADSGWRSRTPGQNRWLSTNHLMGRGYWVWLIPLGSGSTSVGIVADEAVHPFTGINRFEKAAAWLRRYEPQVAERVDAAADRLEDFLALRHYAYGSERVYSGAGWATVGEAGLFTDPFYSPGSDFIAIANDCAADLIVRSAQGEDFAARAEAFNGTYLRLYEAFLRVYEGQYPIMGNPQVMTVKAAWDNACYWAVPALLYFQRRFRDPAFMSSIEPLMRRFFVLHARMQQCLRRWAEADAAEYAPAFTNVTAVPELYLLQASLAGPRQPDDELRARLCANVGLLDRFALACQNLASRIDPALGRFVPDGSDPLDLSALTLTPVPAARTPADAGS